MELSPFLKISHPPQWTSGLYSDHFLHLWFSRGKLHKLVGQVARLSGPCFLRKPIRENQWKFILHCEVRILWYIELNDMGILEWSVEGDERRLQSIVDSFLKLPSRISVKIAPPIILRHVFLGGPSRRPSLNRGYVMQWNCHPSFVFWSPPVRSSSPFEVITDQTNQIERRRRVSMKPSSWRVTLMIIFHVVLAYSRSKRKLAWNSLNFWTEQRKPF